MQGKNCNGYRWLARHEAAYQQNMPCRARTATPTRRLKLHKDFSHQQNMPCRARTATHEFREFRAGSIGPTEHAVQGKNCNEDHRMYDYDNETPNRTCRAGQELQLGFCRVLSGPQRANRTCRAGQELQPRETLRCARQASGPTEHAVQGKNCNRSPHGRGQGIAQVIDRAISDSEEHRAAIESGNGYIFGYVDDRGPQPL